MCSWEAFWSVLGRCELYKFYRTSLFLFQKLDCFRLFSSPSCVQMADSFFLNAPTSSAHKIYSSQPSKTVITHPGLTSHGIIPELKVAILDEI